MIFVSADTSEQSQLEGLDLGADDYLTKPVVTTVLRARVRNILQRKRAEAQLRLAAHVFEYSGEAIMITDRDNCIIEVNPAFTRMTGYRLEEVRGQNPRILSSGRATPEDYQAMWQAIREQGFWQGEMWDRRKDGEIYPKLLTISVVRNVRGEIDFHIASFADISEQKATEEKIRHVAHHDALTGLPNRLYLQIGLEQILASAKRENEEVAVMFIDLDRFKIINDTLGHNVGDRPAGGSGAAAQKVRARKRSGGAPGRRRIRGGCWAGDDVIACRPCGGKYPRQPCPALPDRRSRSAHSTSIGISLYPHDGDSIESLMKTADTAMYHAKAMGRNNFQFFSSEMNQSSSERLQTGKQPAPRPGNGEFAVSLPAPGGYCFWPAGGRRKP